MVADCDRGILLGDLSLIELLIRDGAHLVTDVPHDTARCHLRLITRKKTLLPLIDVFLLFEVFDKAC